MLGFVRLSMDHWPWMVQSFEKISKHHFFKLSKIPFLRELKTTPKFFSNHLSTNIVARGVQNFCVPEGTTDALIDQVTLEYYEEMKRKILDT